jgi:hypothetical protein
MARAKPVECRDGVRLIVAGSKNRAGNSIFLRLSEPALVTRKIFAFFLPNALVPVQ